MFIVRFSSANPITTESPVDSVTGVERLENALDESAQFRREALGVSGPKKLYGRS